MAELGSVVLGTVGSDRHYGLYGLFQLSWPILLSKSSWCGYVNNRRVSCQRKNVDVCVTSRLGAENGGQNVNKLIMSVHNHTK